MVGSHGYIEHVVGSHGYIEHVVGSHGNIDNVVSINNFIIDAQPAVRISIVSIASWQDVLYLAQ